MINFVKMYLEFIYFIFWQILISMDTAKTKIFNASWNTTLKLELMNTIYKPLVKYNFEFYINKNIWIQSILFLTNEKYYWVVSLRQKKKIFIGLQGLNTEVILLSLLYDEAKGDNFEMFFLHCRRGDNFYQIYLPDCSILTNILWLLLLMWKSFFHAILYISRLFMSFLCNNIKLLTVK